MPTLGQLGHDLLSIPAWRKTLTLSLPLPFVWCGGYFCCALNGWWVLAVLALVALSFVTYGSISHDLVHRNLRLPRTVNDLFLCVIELLALRSGHAYQAAHLHHHARFPDADDIEAAACRRSFFFALAEGVWFQPRVWIWAIRSAKHARAWIWGEGIACLGLIGSATALLPVTIIPFAYVALMVVGAWVIPLVTSYVPHDPQGDSELTRTRLFRGTILSLLALEHLYHLEHHLYPAVPHHNWPKLARRLDPHFRAAGLSAHTLWY